MIWKELLAVSINVLLIIDLKNLIRSFLKPLLGTGTSKTNYREVILMKKGQIIER
jgi:hypothetical protein